MWSSLVRRGGGACGLCFRPASFSDKLTWLVKKNTGKWTTFRLKGTATGTAAAAKGSLIFGKYLLLTNTVTSGFLMAAGDLMQQEIEYREGIVKHRYEWDRVGRMFIIGLIQGSPQHLFYGLLDKHLPGTVLKTIGKKIILDQLIASPFCIFLFFYGMGLMEGKNLEGCNAEVKKKFAVVYMTDWCVWPPVQFVNFCFVPGQYRVLYINAMTMLYNVFLSYIKHIDYPHDKKNNQ